LEDIIAAVAEAGGSITGAAELLGISKQAVSKRLRGVRVLHEQWARRDGDGKTEEVFEKEYSVAFEERVEKSVSREARTVRKKTEERDVFSERLEDMRRRAEAVEQEAEELSKRATTAEDVDALSGKISEAQSTKKALQSVTRNIQTLIGETNLALDEAKKNLEAAARRAVLAWREDTRREVLSRLEAILAMDCAFSRAATSGLNRLGQDQGLPLSAGILGIWEGTLLPPDGKIEEVVRDLKQALNAPAEAEKRRAEAAEYEAKFRHSSPHRMMRTKR
jgi:predicted transcriptional regulator